MAQNEQVPDWLIELREQQLGERPREEEGPQQQVDQVFATEDLQDQQVGQADVLEDLREQMIQVEEELEQERKSSFVHILLSLKPGQRLLLAILLFLNVALVGLMLLLVTGRVMF